MLSARYLKSFAPAGALLAGFVFCPDLFAQQTDPATDRATQLKKLSLEQLLEQQITTAGRKPQALENIPAATELISSDDIHRSGVTTLPDVLRLATGVHVARATASSWAVSSRGFNTTTADKMQVFMDGRSLYTPLFSGVFWDVQDFILDDIERIEVTRGPNATLWGANAFNGFINIITKSAKDTQGAYVNAAAGSEDIFGSVRYGGKIGDSTYYRAYVKTVNHDSLRFTNGDSAHDSQILGRTGFRVDSDLSAQTALMFEGEYYDGRLGVNNNRDSAVDGGHFITRWTSRLDEASELQLQAFYDYSHRHIYGFFEEKLHTVDFDALYRRALNLRNEIMAGLNYRIYHDDIGNENPAFLSFEPPHRSIQDVNGFLQYEFKIIPDRLSVTAGSKFEHNDFSGFEYQPSLRVAWNPIDRTTLWAGVSRAVRTPTRFDEDFSIPGIGLVPMHRFESEKVIAYELGWRMRPLDNLALDVAAFYNDYDDLRSQERESGPTGPLTLRNLLEGEGYGIESSVEYDPTDWWRLRASYTYFEKQLRASPGGADVTRGAAEGNDPHHFGAIRSSWDLPQNLFFDAVLRYVTSLPSPPVPGYVELDLRLAWRPKKNLEVAISGLNLLDNQHPEFGAATPLREEVERSGYLEITWSF